MVNIKNAVEKVLSNSENSLLSIAGDAEPKARVAVNTYLTSLKERATLLLEYMASDTGDTQNDKIYFLASRLKDERPILESEFLSFVVMGKQIAENAINAITTILVTAIGEVLPAPAP